MLSKSECETFEKAFRSYPLTRDLSLRVEDNRIILSLNLPFSDFEGHDMFFFSGNSAESFFKELEAKAYNYNAIEMYWLKFRQRRREEGEEKAEACVQFDLYYFETVEHTLKRLAKLSWKVLTELKYPTH